jgi:dimethylamine monooxygenase subunit C
MTSVPLWEDPPRSVNPRARQLVLIGIGEPAVPIVQRWFDSVPVGAEAWFRLCASFDAQLRAELDEQLARARVGWRAMVCGPEIDIVRLQAQALAAGAVPGELTLAVTDTSARSVYCAHCAATTHTQHPGPVQCSGCGLGLVVRQHFSPRRAAYLGVADG